MIYAVCPFSRPEFLGNVIENFERQTCSEKRLILVENGDAIGACEAQGFVPDILLTSQRHQSHAKNAGLDWITSNGGGWFSTFDDDDYYGPKYLEEVLECSEKGDIVGKSNHFVVGIDGHLRYFDLGIASQYGLEAHGATLSARAELCPRFQDTGSSLFSRYVFRFLQIVPAFLRERSRDLGEFPLSFSYSLGSLT